jgi:hypothetical protein
MLTSLRTLVNQVLIVGGGGSGVVRLTTSLGTTIDMLMPHHLSSYHS